MRIVVDCCQHLNIDNKFWSGSSVGYPEVSGLPVTNTLKRSLK